jgi:hypothetical protein
VTSRTHRRLSGGLGLRRAALTGVIAVGLAGCGSVTEAAGRVVDPAGRPVAGALVLLRRAGQAPRDAQFAERADRTGGFHAILHGGYFPPDAVLSVCAPGFAPAEQRVAGGGWQRASRSNCGRGAVRGRSARSRRASPWSSEAVRPPSRRHRRDRAMHLTTRCS